MHFQHGVKLSKGSVKMDWNSWWSQVSICAHMVGRWTLYLFVGIEWIVFPSAQVYEAAHQMSERAHTAAQKLSEAAKDSQVYESAKTWAKEIRVSIA